MLRWTPGGAVASPTILQIRVQRRYPERIRAGAPVPTRSMTAEEIARNLHHHTVGMRGPRTRPCTELVLSGEGVAGRSDLPALVARARQDGITRTLLHLGATDAPRFDADAWAAVAPELVLPLGEDLDAARALVVRAAARGLLVRTQLALGGDALDRIDRIALALPSLGAASHTFTFPFPTDPESAAAAPDPARAAAALDRVVPALRAAGLAVGVKGLPACYLGAARDSLGRTGNRWYVDADHQGPAALLFFPDVVAFHRGEACRFCARAERCDGFFATYLQRPDAAPLAPLAG